MIIHAARPHARTYTCVRGVKPIFLGEKCARRQGLYTVRLLLIYRLVIASTWGCFKSYSGYAASDRNWSDSRPPGRAPRQDHTSRILQRKEEASTRPDSFAPEQKSLSPCARNRPNFSRQVYLSAPARETKRRIREIRLASIRGSIRRALMNELETLYRISPLPPSLVVYENRLKLPSNSLRLRDGNSRCVVPYR